MSEIHQNTRGGDEPTTCEPLTPPLTINDLIYVSEIERNQEERIESLIQLLRDNSRNHKIGHVVLFCEIEVDGKPRIGRITNGELGDLVGKSGWLRAEELATIGMLLLKQHGNPKIEIGYEEGLKWSRECWRSVDSVGVGAAGGDDNERFNKHDL